VNDVLVDIFSKRINVFPDKLSRLEDVYVQRQNLYPQIDTEKEILKLAYFDFLGKFPLLKHIKTNMLSARELDELVIEIKDYIKTMEKI
jgi:hypothetical protein